MTNAEIILHLIAARKKLAQGWCQGLLHRLDNDGNEQWCIGGALFLGEIIGGEIIQHVTRAIPNFECYWVCLPHWNDEPGRTQQEVLDVVDRAIALLMKVEAAEVVKREELVEA